MVNAPVVVDRRLLGHQRDDRSLRTPGQGGRSRKMQNVVSVTFNVAFQLRQGQELRAEEIGRFPETSE
jgi:hypothetical protein